MSIAKTIEAFREKFGFEEIYVCKNCKHSVESHYWNGGGRVENSGYDACLLKDCKCECLTKDYDIKKIPVNRDIEAFLAQALEDYKKEVLRETRNFVNNIELTEKNPDAPIHAIEGWDACANEILSYLDSEIEKE